MKNQNLVRLLGGWVNDDQVVDQDSAEEGLTRMLEVAPIQQQRDAASEIARLLSGGLCENQIRDVLLFEVGCEYPFERDGYDASSWLKHLRRRLLDNVESRRSEPEDG